MRETTAALDPPHSAALPAGFRSAGAARWQVPQGRGAGPLWHLRVDRLRQLTRVPAPSPATNHPPPTSFPGAAPRAPSTPRAVRLPPPVWGGWWWRLRGVSPGPQRGGSRAALPAQVPDGAGRAPRRLHGPCRPPAARALPSLDSRVSSAPTWGENSRKAASRGACRPLPNSGREQHPGDPGTRAPLSAGSGPAATPTPTAPPTPSARHPPWPRPRPAPRPKNRVPTRRRRRRGARGAERGAARRRAGRTPGPGRAAGASWPRRSARARPTAPR